MKIFQKLIVIFHEIDPPRPCLRSFFNLRNMVILLFHVQWLFTSLVFILTEGDSLREYTTSFYILTTAIGSFNNYIIVIRKMSNIFKLIDDFENAIEKRLKNPESKLIYEKINKQIDNWAGILDFILVPISLPSIILPSFAMSYYNYFINDLESEAFQFAFPVWLPFNWRTPYGYVFAFSIQAFSGYLLLKLSVFVLGFMIGSCCILMSLADDAKIMLRILNESKNKSPIEFKDHFINFLNFHANTKELISDFMDIEEFTFTAYFLWSVSTICSALLMCQLSNNPLELIEPLTLIYWSFCAIFIFCNFGENLTSRFNELSDAIYECEWHLFPNNIQRVLPIIMNSAQQAIILRGFGNVSCTREAFKKVANGGFSYFMVLRQFGR